MVVRRIREHVVSHNWFAVAVDIVIVVVGVFLGQQVSNWNEARLDSNKARDYRGRLLQELDFNERQFASQVTYYERAQHYGERALKALDDPSADASQFVIDAYQLSQIDQAPAKTYIYQEMVAGGFVAGIGDERTQNLASDYYLNVAISNESVGQTPPYRELVRGTVPFSIQRAIESKCGDKAVMFDGRLVGLTLSETCDLTIPPAEAASIAAKIRAIPDLRRHMTRYLGTISEKNDLLEFNRDETRALVNAVRGQAIGKS